MQTQCSLQVRGRGLHDSEKLEKAGTADFRKHPARKVGTRSGQCRPEVRGRFAFPGAPNPRICSISRFGYIFPAIFPGLSQSFPQEPPNRPRKQPQPSRGNSHSLLEFPEWQIKIILDIFSYRYRYREILLLNYSSMNSYIRGGNVVVEHISLGLRKHRGDLEWIFALDNPSHRVDALWVVSLEVPRTEMVSLQVFVGQHRNIGIQEQ